MQDVRYFGKGSRLVSCREFHVVEWHLEPAGKLLDVRMIGNDAHDVARQLSCPPALQDLHETVARLGGQKGDTFVGGRPGERSVRHWAAAEENSALRPFASRPVKGFRVTEPESVSTS